MKDLNQYTTEFDNVVNSVVVTNKLGNKLDNAFLSMVNEFKTIANNNGTVYLIGNGGSSGIISHVSIDLINACKIKAHPITDNSILTCLANDYGYEQVFAEALKTLITPNDLLIAVSSSGNSKNIINAVNLTVDKGAKVMTFSGFKPDNNLRKIGHINLWIESSSYGYVEIGHALLLHFITDSYCNL